MIAHLVELPVVLGFSFFGLGFVNNFLPQLVGIQPNRPQTSKMDTKMNEISQTRGCDVKERPDLRRPHQFPQYSDQRELDPFAGGDRSLTAIDTSNWTKDVKSVLDETTSQLSVNQNNHSTTENISKNSENSINCSKLSPYAKEFVPRSQTVKVPEATLSPYAEEFVPRSNYREQPQAEADEPEEESYPIHELRNFLFEVTFAPEKFDQRLQYLTNILNEYISDEILLSTINIIFEESINEPNIRYNGAKLCNHLSQNLICPSGSGKFRNVLLKRCQLEHSKYIYQAREKGGSMYLRGYALFMAELYSQLEVAHNNNTRIDALGSAILEILDTLLKFSSPDHIKCVCQILKCVGGYLEDQERRMHPSGASLDVICNSMRRIVDTDHYTNDIKKMVSNVLEIRSVDWGRATSPAPSSPNESLTENTHLNEPVFYGPDGLPITPEEALFLESQRLSPDYPDIDEFDDDIYDNDEMDEVIQEAYEEFLRSTGQ